MKLTKTFFYLILLISGLFFNCKGEKTQESLDPADFLSNSICKCSDDLYAFNLEAQKTLPNAKDELRKQILLDAENQIDQLETCIIKEMGRKNIKKGEVDILLLEKKLIENCTNKPGSFNKRVLDAIKGIL